MVSVKHLEKKLSSLLIDGSTTKKNNWNSSMRYRYRFEQFKKKHPERCNTLTNKIIADLSELEKAVFLKIVSQKESTPES